jgi:serine protease Do
MFKKAALILVIVFIGGVSGIITDRYFFPYLMSTKVFSRYDFLKKSAQEVTVINRTEQVYVKEESSIKKLASQAVSSVVNIVSFSDPEFSKLPKISSQVDFKNGTGIIATSDGLIIAHSSAINLEGSKYKVITYDNNTYDGQLIGHDPYSGLVFIKISASNLPAAAFGDSDSIQSGEKFIAVGNSQQNQTPIFETGIINSYDPFYNTSGKSIYMPERLQGSFRIDLPEGSQCVGGPIVDYSGELIAVVGSLKNNGADEYFGIPSNVVKGILEKAIRNEIDLSPSLGIYYIPLNKSVAMGHNLLVENGALVYSPSGQQGLAVITGSNASKADIRINDIITKVNEEEISEKNSLGKLLYRYKKGDKIDLSVIRNGQEITASVSL